MALVQDSGPPFRGNETGPHAAAGQSTTVQLWAAGVRMRSDGRPPGSRGCRCETDGGASPHALGALGAPPAKSCRQGSSRHSQSFSSVGSASIQEISPAQRRSRGWVPSTHSPGGALLRALALCVLWSALQPAAGQPLGNSISPTSVVSTSAFFASSLAAGPPYNTLLIVRGASSAPPISKLVGACSQPTATHRLPARCSLMCADGAVWSMGLVDGRQSVVSAVPAAQAF